MSTYQAVIQTPIGKLGIKTSQHFLTTIDFLPAATKVMKAKDDFTNIIVKQLAHYFADSAFNFDLPLKTNGTDFQQKVWRAMTKIPVGQTITYGQLAKQLKSSPRAIGGACRRNPIPVIIPCHRIVATQSLGGYSSETSQGRFINIKKWLLQHEQI